MGKSMNRNALNSEIGNRRKDFDPQGTMDRSRQAAAPLLQARCGNGEDRTLGRSAPQRGRPVYEARRERNRSRFGPAAAGHQPDPFFHRNELVGRKLLEVLMEAAWPED